VKHTSLRNRVAKIEKRLALKAATVRIEGGLPPDFKPPAAQPPGGDLKAQHAMFAKPKPAPPAAGQASGRADAPTAASGLPKRS
jgi:hypothetical protein